MALIKASALVSDLRGSVGGCTFSRSLAGAIARRRVRPTRMPNVAATRTNAAHSIRIDHWRSGLTDAERIVWNTAAQTVRWTNRLGEEYAPSGFQLYMRQAAELPTYPYALPHAPVYPLKTPQPPVYLEWNEANDHIYLKTFPNQDPPASGFLTLWRSDTLPPTWYHHGGPSTFIGIRTFSTGVAINAPITQADPTFRPSRVWLRIVASLGRYTQSDPIILAISIPPAP